MLPEIDQISLHHALCDQVFVIRGSLQFGQYEKLHSPSSKIMLRRRLLMEYMHYKIKDSRIDARKTRGKGTEATSMRAEGA